MTNLDWVLPAVQRHGTWDAVFVGGSWARGWHNPASDIDVYALGADQPKSWVLPVDDPSIPRIDVHEITAVQVEALLERVDWTRVSSGEDFVDTLKTSDWLFLERLHHARVLTGRDRVDALCTRLAASAHRFMLVQQHFTHADAYAEDSLGQIEAGDWESAIFSGQAAYLRAVDGMLSASGHYSYLNKWRSRLMREARTPVAYEEYWRLSTMAELPAMGLREWAIFCVSAARDLMSRVDLGTFEVLP